jgi:succinate dehydrogenase / fumarate reductase iron-sulfur subunit
MCMTRISALPAAPVTVTPLRAFPVIRDLVTDVSFNYAKAKRSYRLLLRRGWGRASTG